LKNNYLSSISFWSYCVGSPVTCWVCTFDRNIGQTFHGSKYSTC